VRPHAVTAVTASTGGQDSYGYNANGSQTSRSIGGTTATLTWDQENRLTNHTKSGAVTSYVYDADGARLIRKDPAGATLYLDGMELRKTSTALTASRYYTTAEGATLAVRTPTALSWLLTDHQASNTIAVNHATGAITRQRYTPYGAHRGANATLPTDRGYLGKTEDDSTGLLATDNRYYDPTLARFISVDPLADLANPQTLNPYSYAANNPITYSDPSGLLLISGNNPGGYYEDWAAQIRANGFESPSAAVTAPEPEYSMAWFQNGATGAVSGALATVDFAVSVSTGGLAARALGASPPSLSNGFDNLARRAGANPDSTGARIGEYATILTGGAGILRGGVKLIGKGFRKLTTKADETVAAANTGSQIAANQAAGNAARDALAAGHPGALIEQSFSTTAGVRRLDILTQSGLGIESKVGRTSLTATTRSQIAKDSLLVRNGDVTGIEWVFSRSAVTGRIGPTAPLADALSKASIPWSLAP